jgi:L-alanine-DL-glutamate epimerase-like enolase superfamily enzyme
LSLSGTRILSIVDRIEVVPLAIPYERPTAGGKGGVPVLFTHVNPVYVRMWTADGLEGFGYATSFSGEMVLALAEMIGTLAGRVIGRDVNAVGAIIDELGSSLAHSGTHGFAHYALAAVETALWDIKAKALGLPLFRLLGGERTEIDVYANHLLWRNWTKDELVRDAQQLVGEGFRAIKMNAGRIDVGEDLERLQVVREAVGPSVRIHVDSNWSWDYAEALRYVRGAERYGITWIEDPLRSNNPWELAQLAAISPIEVAAGELLADPVEVRQFLEAKATRHLQLDLQYMGGIGGWLRGAAVADANGARVSSHLFHDVSAHLASATRNVAYVEYMNWWDVLYAEPLKIRDGKIVLTERPGLGLSLREDALKTYALR